LIFLFYTEILGKFLPGQLREAVKDEEIQRQLKFGQKLWKSAHGMNIPNKIGDMSVECGLCGIAINEVEGFLAENISLADMESYLQNDLCSIVSGSLQAICNAMAAEIPTIVSGLDNRWSVSVVCVDIGYCQVPFHQPSDPQSLPVYTINLDLPPNQRWVEICSMSLMQNYSQYLYQVITSILPDGGTNLNMIGEAINELYMPTELAQEIQGCATALGVPYGWVSLFNLGYEVSDACTSIVAQDSTGKILHSRNLDFWPGMGFTDTLKAMSFIAEWQKGGKTVFHTTSIAGYVGSLSGMKPGAFSLTIDTRFYPNGPWELFYEVVAALEEKNSSLVAFLSREVLQNENDFTSALAQLSNVDLIADVYYIMAGVSAGEGVVISRNRTDAANVWMLDAPGRWFEVETNYDHWEPPPWFDDRYTPAVNAMNAMGANNATLAGMFEVMSTKPVLNLQTIHTLLACPADGTYESYIRWCPYPCVQ